MSWFSLPTFSLPVPSLPTNLQHRLVSFAIRQALSRFVKLESLNQDQINSQIGSGVLEVSGLLLREDIINGLCSGAPLKFEQGAIAKVAARLPWPNLLTAPISVSISDINLRFSFATKESPDISQDLDLAESVASLAESFVHDELTPDEDRELEASLRLPGAFEEFVTERTSEPSAMGSDVQPVSEDVNLIARLIENLISRLTISITNLCVEILLPNGSEVVFKLPQIVCETSEGPVRTARLSGLHIMFRENITKHGPSSSSSSSSMDDETTMIMSQGIADLGQPDLIQSKHPAAIFVEPSDQFGTEFVEKTILAFDARPVILTLQPYLNESTGQSMRLDVDVGNVGLAQSPIHIAALMDAISLASAAARLNPSPAPQKRKNQPRPLHITCDIKAINFLLLHQLIHQEDWTNCVDPFLRKTITIPPAIPHIHLTLQSIQVQLIAQQPSHKVLARIKDIALMIGSVSSSQPSKWISTPVIITDPNLTTQSLVDERMAEDWRQGLDTYKPSHWRIRRSSISVGNSGSSTSPEQDPFCHISIHKEQLQLHIPSLHLFCDMENITPLVNFMGCVESLRTVSSDRDARGDATPPHRMHTSKEGLPESEVRFSDGKNNDLSKNSSSRQFTGNPTLSLDILVPHIRLSIRCNPMNTQQIHTQNRSGALMIDIRRFEVRNNTMDQQSEITENKREREPMTHMQWSSLDVLISRQKDLVSQRLLSICGNLNGNDPLKNTGPRISFASPSQRSIACNVPLIKGLLTKRSLDAIQYFVDDVSKFFSKVPPLSTPKSSTSLSQSSRILGSRYFIDSKQPSILAASPDDLTNKNLYQVKLQIDKALLTLDAASNVAEGKTILNSIHVDSSQASVQLDICPANYMVGAFTSLSLVCLLLDNHGNSVEELFYGNSQLASSRASLEARFSSYSVPGSVAKESSVKISVNNASLSLPRDLSVVEGWLGLFKPPPDTFETVPPSEKTRVSCNLHDVLVQLRSPCHPGALLLYVQDGVSDIVVAGTQGDTIVNTAVQYSSVHFVPDTNDVSASSTIAGSRQESLQYAGYGLIAEVRDASGEIQILHQVAEAAPTYQVNLSRLQVSVHLCADTLTPLAQFLSKEPSESIEKNFETPSKHHPKALVQGENLLASVDEQTFKRAPYLEADPDFVRDDVPMDMEYLDASYGAAGGLRDLPDDGVDYFDEVDIIEEAVRIKDPDGIQVVEGYFDNLLPYSTDDGDHHGDRTISITLRNCDVSLRLYRGYDWKRTQKIIEDEHKRIRKRLVKIRQFLAKGQTLDDEEAPANAQAFLFNSVHLGLPEDTETLNDDELLAAIDQELAEESEEALEASWETIKQSKPQSKSAHAVYSSPRILVQRSREPFVEILLSGVGLNYDRYLHAKPFTSRLLLTSRDIDIIDHMKSSTWHRFLTSMRYDLHGNIRESESNMARIELLMLKPVESSETEEARLRAKLLPLRLHVDQDALDFFKAFFAFQYPEPPTTTTKPQKDELFFQRVEIFPVQIKLDYKPKRVDYAALKEGRTIELMNFFHFDGAEMTLRHLTLAGVVGFPRLFDTLNDLWTPDVKAHQLSDIVAGVSPIRSVVNVGTGVADLVLLPIATYQKDKRVVKGIRRGAKSFMKSTALEAVVLGARLATGTQVILEGAENVLGGEGWNGDLLTEAVAGPTSFQSESEAEQMTERISRYADQPMGIKDGLQSAYKSISKNLNLAGQTILALPMEIHERTGNDGPVRTVVRAVPIAILKPMIGATEAVSKTLLGLRNTLDPERRVEDERKYKHRS